LEIALAVGDRTDEEGSVRDRLVARNGEVAADRRRGLDDHESSNAGETITE
jgi:hypothetical protein